MKLLRILLLFIYLQLAKTKRSFVMQLTRCTAEHHNSKYVENVACEVGRTAQGPFLNAQFALPLEVAAFELSFTLDMLRKDNSKINLARVKVPGCKFMRSENEFLPFKLLLSKLRRVSNLPHQCPVKAGFVFAIRNYTFNVDDYPPFTPQMTWIAVVSLWVNNRAQLDLVVHGRVAAA